MSEAWGGADARASEDVRHHNLALVARYVADAGPTARSEIATATGLSRASVTALTAVLVDAEVLGEAEPEPAARRGRRLQKLSISAPSVALVVVLIDADEVTVVVADLMGVELARLSASHGRPIGDPTPILDHAARLLTQGLERASALDRRVVDLTVVAFAPVGGDPEIVIADTDLGWGAVDILTELHTRFARLPDRAPWARQHLVADVLVAAAAEFASLPAATEALYIKSDSGIGGASLIRGSLLRGANGLAGAFGHVAVVPDGDPCLCGQRGCLVTVAGPDVVLDRAGLGDLLASAGLTHALEQFVERVQRGDERCVSAWQDAAHWIGHTLGVLAMVFDPSVIVVGGYWASLVDDIDREFRSNRPSIEATQVNEIPVIAGRLGRNAALRGALREARSRFLDDPLALR